MKISKEFKIGAIVIIALLGFWWLSLFFKGKNLFSNDVEYYVKYDNVSGLDPSRPVSIKGMKVGSIESISPITKGNDVSFLVKIKIDKKYRIPKSTKAQIYEGLMSGAEIRLILSKGEIAKNKDTLIGILSKSITGTISDEIIPIKDNLNAVLKNLEMTLTSVNSLLNTENIDNIGIAIKNLDLAILQFKNMAQSVDKLIGNNSDKISSLVTNADGFVTTTGETVKKYGELADNLNQMEFEKLSRNLNLTLENINVLTSQLNETEGTLGKLMNDPALYDNLNHASQNLNSLLIDFQINPKKYIHFSVFGKKSKPTTIIMDTIYSSR